MSAFADLGIKTYEDYRKNKRDIFDIVHGMFEEYMDKHPEFVKQIIDESLKHYVSIEDLAVGDTNVFRVAKENNSMKRYKLTRSPNPETHASGEVIFIKDENGNELNVGFGDQCNAFDYIKLQVENDKEYADCLNNPSKHIMDMYNSLDEFDKKMIEQSLIQKYRNECMYQYFR